MSYEEDPLGYQNIIYPIFLTLLDNSIAVVEKDGIHFYDYKFSNEDISKIYNFTESIDPDNDIIQASIKQFSKLDDGYILVLVNYTIYFFNKEKNFIEKFDLEGNFGTSRMEIIPFKNDKTYLHYLVTFNNDIFPKINYYTINLNSPYSNTKVKEKVININNKDCFVCLFMTLLSSYNSGPDILNCIGRKGDYPFSLFSASFDPENNFEEIISLRYIETSSFLDGEPAYFNVMTNDEKKKALIYVVKGIPYWGIFDYNNKFSSFTKENLNYYGELVYKKPNHNLFYFTEKKEFVAISSFNGCDKFILVYNNYLVTTKGIIRFNNCYNSKTSNIFFNGENYMIVTDGESSSVFATYYKSINEIENIPITVRTTIVETEPILESSKFTINISESIMDKRTSETTIYSTESIINTFEPTIESTESEIINTEHTIITTEPFIIASESIKISSETKIDSTEKTIITSEQTIDTAESIIISSEPTIFITDSTVYNSEPTNIKTEGQSMIFSAEDSISMSDSIFISENYSKNIKCKTSNFQSSIYNLCISCNTEKDFYPAEFPNNSFLHGFYECYNNITKPINFYFDYINKTYKPCYETCETCNEGGNSEINKCLTCDFNHRKEPDSSGTTNCITECAYLYYLSPYGQYKCTNDSNCPDTANLYIKEIKKCTDNCNKEGTYKYQYGGECLKKCPNNTSPNNEKICIDENIDECTKSQREINLQEFLIHRGIDINAKNYAKEFGYTIKHISYLYNNIYSIVLYKDLNCIEELSINLPKIDFGDCYTKIQKNLEPPTNEKLIIALIEKSNGQKKSTTSYLFYHPETGERIDTAKMCEDEEIIVKESVLSQLNNSNSDVDSILFLTQQNINVFNLSDEFYTDICYYFESPNGKDATLKDRVKSYYPNITLCDTNCNCKGVNLTSMESICECKFKNFINNELIEENALLSSTIGEISDILSRSNLDVLKCYKNVFKKEYIKKSFGAFIMIGIAFLEIIFSFIFLFRDMDIIRKFLFNLTEYFIILINIKKNYLFKNSNLSKNSKIKAPPQKKKRKKKLNYRKGIFNDDEFSKISNTCKTEIKILERKSLNFKDTNNIKNKNRYSLLPKIEIFNDKNTLLNAKNKYGNINMEEYLKTDLDNLEYDDAIKKDKRTFCEFFFERLKEKQIIMNTFYYKENIRPMTIKIIILLLNIDLYFIINGLFFDEEYISKLFNSTEEEKFFSFFPRSLSRFFYASLVGLIVEIIINCIFIEEKKIKRTLLREKDDLLQLRYEISIIAKSIKKRYIIFIILCLFISIISWYYVSCFNNVYPGVKIEWIKSSITIIFIMQILSILIVFVEDILRVLSFYYKSEKLYKLKKIIS